MHVRDLVAKDCDVDPSDAQAVTLDTSHDLYVPHEHANFILRDLLQVVVVLNQTHDEAPGEPAVVVQPNQNGSNMRDRGPEFE